MRKILVLTLLVACFVCTSVFAGGSGNPIQPIKTTTDRHGIGAAFGYNFVGSRMMELYSFDGQDNFKVNDISQVYGIISLGANEQSNIAMKVGACNYDFKFDDENNSETVDVEMEDGIYVGLGMNFFFPREDWNWGPVSMGWGFSVQGNAYLNDVKSVKHDGVSGTNEDGTVYGADGENSIYMTCKYDVDKIKTSIVPYLGIYHSWIALSTLDPVKYDVSNKKTTQEHDFLGAFDALTFGLKLGLDVEITKYVVFNIEGRMIGETAITTGATIKF